MSKKLAVVVDAQNDFMNKNGALSVNGAHDIINATDAWLANLNPEEYEAVLFTFDTHDKEVYEKSPEGEMFPLHCERGTWGWQLAIDEKLVNPALPRFHLLKSVFNMWEEDNLVIVNPTENGSQTRDDFVRSLKEKGVDTVDLVGVASEFCVLWAIQGWVDSGFKVNVFHDNVRGIEKQIEQVVDEHFKDKPVQIV